MGDSIKLDGDVVRFTASIVAAHSSHNQVPTRELPDIIRSVYVALRTVGTAPVVEALPTPAVPVKRSVFPDYLVCLEDGKKLKMLKRHLQTSYGMTPDAYRARWSLPKDYPMVAPNYAARRSTLAKTYGLGRKPAPPPEPEVVVQQIPEGKRGRKVAAKKAKLVETAASAD